MISDQSSFGIPLGHWTALWNEIGLSPVHRVSILVFYLRKHQLLLSVSRERSRTYTVGLFERRVACVTEVCVDAGSI